MLAGHIIIFFCAGSYFRLLFLSHGSGGPSFRRLSAPGRQMLCSPCSPSHRLRDLPVLSDSASLLLAWSLHPCVAALQQACTLIVIGAREVKLLCFIYSVECVALNACSCVTSVVLPLPPPLSLYLSPLPYTTASA